MKIQRVRGTRDFYPEDMAIQSWIADAWRRVSLRNGFLQYDGPILETMDLYRAKSGDEIVGQLFRIDSRSGEELAIRPEMTPTLARMINAKVQSLPRPIKWFGIGPFYRGERPQRGRSREFLQWNVDVVGTDDLLADAECIFVAVDLLREIGLGPEDVVVWINDRRLMAAVFGELGIPESRHLAAYALVDKADRMERAKLAAVWAESLGDVAGFEAIEPLLAVESLEALRSCDHSVMRTPTVTKWLAELESLFLVLQDFGITEFCDFKMTIVRGLAYYTGCVFEAFDRQGKLRAVLGGGRYDNLLRALGGPDLSGVGFGMGDPVVLELLRELNRLPDPHAALDVFVVAADDESASTAVRLVADLRGRGVRTDFAYRRQAVAKQFKAASARGAERCVIVGTETRERDTVTIKDMSTGAQTQRPMVAFLADPLASIPPSQNP
ncbi:MAG: histidine--tRNA ligase [Phycisphaerae bacterium]|nr:histidine--tRNA ligase [Phycisphaerae bacterium]